MTNSQTLIPQDYAVWRQNAKIISAINKARNFFSELFILEESVSCVSGLLQEGKVNTSSTDGIEE